MTDCTSTLGPGHVLCNSDHCNQFQETTNFHRICNCIDWQGNPIPNCSPKDNLYPVETAQCYNKATGEIQNISSEACSNLIRSDPNWEWQTCYCCCSCFAFGTPIEAVGGYRPIESFEIGDQVMVASHASGSWEWAPDDVQYSNGTGPNSSNPLMIYVHFGDNKSLIASADQLFMLADGKLQRADKLRPGKDQLMSVDCHPVDIHQLRAGSFKGGIHHIATEIVDADKFDGNLDNHLLNSNGVISGDYLLQLYQNLPVMKQHMETSAPKVGTPEFIEANPSLVVEAHMVSVPEHADVDANRHNFDQYRANAEGIIPQSAALYMTLAQEAELSSAPSRPFVDKTNIASLHYLMRLYSGFYPDVRFYLDWENSRPNAFAFREFGQEMVVVSGALLRLENALYMEGMSVMLSHCVSALQTEAPMNSNGYECTGQADYAGSGIVMREVYTGESYTDVTAKGLAQVSDLFKLIKTNTGGDNKCSDPSLKCRMEALNTAVDGSGNLPSCAGGPEVGGLKVKDATAPDLHTVLVKFNVPVSAYSAEKTQNYAFKDGTMIAAAHVDPAHPSQVILTARLTANTNYELTVRNVYADSGSTLDPKKSKASFKTKGH
jgi:hypothetical protein